MITTAMTHGTQAFDDCKFIRTQVFVEEQGFVQEFDDIDPIACHIVLYDDGIPAAAGRIYPAGNGVWAIGRVAVRKPWRGAGLGTRLMQELEAAARRQGAVSFTLSAQVRAGHFYETLGYTAVGGQYDDEGIPHVRMVKQA